MGGTIRRTAIVVVAALSSLMSLAAIAQARQVAAPTSRGHLVYMGTVNLAASAAATNAASSAPSTAAPRAASPLQPKSMNPAAIAAPAAAASSQLSVQTSPLGFPGLTALDTTTLNGFAVEPPDQGLCAHNGVILEPVNIVIRAYTEGGTPLTPAVSLNQFFGLPPAVSGSGDNMTFGPYVSDPRCHYDPQTSRWFVTALEIAVNPSTGAFDDHSAELIAVSQTSDPTGSYGVFAIDTTNNGTNGTPVEPHCPCFGDQPRIGADDNGFYLSADSYPIHGLFNSNGGELYATSKQALAAAATGTQPPGPLVAIHIGAVHIGGYPANAVQPAETPQGAAYAPNREYFLSTPDFNGFATMGGAGAKAVALWTMSDTSTLSTTPSVSLSLAIVPSEKYTPPIPAVQKPGPHPLGESVGAPLPQISVNDDRMQQVEYVGGSLYSALNTGIGDPATSSGVAWFKVTPNATSGTVTGQGYLSAADHTSLMYPAIGLDTNGHGVMTFSVSGPTIYPSAVYVPFIGQPGLAATVTGPGVAPEDGFTCYAATGFGPTCRWGDYSAASSDGSGNIVMGAEIIPDAPRVPLANWGTFITTVPTP